VRAWDRFFLVAFTGALVLRLVVVVWEELRDWGLL
jgi:hypothetical protein